ncbi:MAG: MSMEG_4193 family putative phosphomutase [Acidimicrobiaceae bacterium]|nr:MSMEG_4193 family putative phosphomutase [Acidimicrobiaceae bacterium]
MPTATSPARPRAARTSRPKPPPGTLILLVRHGTTPTTGQVLPGRAAGLHLADAGRAQAQQCAERIAAWASPRAGTNDKRPRVNAVYASPLERARETAEPIAEALGLRPKIERGLIECDYGTWTGAELKALVKLPEWSTVQRWPSGFHFPGGESFVDMQARMADTLTALVDRHRGDAVVAVSHADPIKAVVAAALGTHLDLFQRIVISPCSITAISYQPSGPIVLAVNSTGSLSELRPS